MLGEGVYGFGVYFGCWGGGIIWAGRWGGGSMFCASCWG